MSKLYAFILLIVGVVCTAAGFHMLVGPAGLVAVGAATVAFALLVDDERE